MHAKLISRCTNTKNDSWHQLITEFYGSYCTKSQPSTHHLSTISTHQGSHCQPIAAKHKFRRAITLTKKLHPTFSKTQLDFMTKFNP